MQVIVSGDYLYIKDFPYKDFVNLVATKLSPVYLRLFTFLEETKFLIFKSYTLKV